MSETTASNATVASAPFDNASTADIIFRTSDHVHFYAHRIILSIASPFFEGMFSISQPPISGGCQVTIDGTPVVEVPEESSTMDCVLRYCYPVRDPIVESLGLLDRVLSAAIKYALDQAIFLATEALRTYVSRSPLFVYAISCRHGLVEEAKLAAAAWRTSLGEYDTTTFLENPTIRECYDESMRDIPAYHYYRLLEYMTDQSGQTTMLCRPFSVLRPAVPLEPELDVYPFNQPSADIILISRDQTRFPVHRGVVEMQNAANPIFPLQSLLITPTPDGRGDNGKPYYLTHEDTTVLSGLLRLCYPARHDNSILQWTDELCCSPTSVRIIAAALRYGMVSLVDVYKYRLRAVVAQRPLDVYCISITFGWYAEAYSAAKYMARHIVLPYANTTWLDDISAQQYHHILEFWYRCQDVIFISTAVLLFARRPDAPLSKHILYRHKGAPEATRDTSIIQHVLAEAMGNDLATSTPGPSRASSQPRDMVAELKEFTQLCVKLGAKFDKAVTLVDFRLC